MASIEENRARVRKWHKEKYASDPEWAKRRNDRVKEWKKNQKLNGLCTGCMKPVTHSTLCEEHFWSSRVQNWKKNGVVGFSLERFWALLDEQKYKCPLCKRELDPITAAVDHCHRTGKVRGILCIRCNCAIGALGDTKESLQEVVKYLDDNVK